MATSRSKAPKGEVIDHDAQLVAAMPELAPAREESAIIGGFFGNLIAFFTEARALEVAAKSTLAIARTLKPPQSAADDVGLQTFVRQASSDRKKIEDHWQIASVVYSFQRRLVAARKRGTDALEEAAGIAQTFHNRYVEDEKRRAREEQERLQREADERARRERQAELDRLEAQALQAEQASPVISAREARFVDFYTGPYRDPERAAQMAGYAKPFDAATRLLALPKIVEAIDAMRRSKALRDQKAAVAERPMQVEQVTVRPNVQKVGVDRTTKTAEVFDARLLVEAVLGGKHGIPADSLMPDPTKLNQYARDLGEVINRWPGVRLVKKTTTV